MAIIKAYFDGTKFIPVEPLDLKVGQIYEITVLKTIEPSVGSPAALLKLMDSLRPIPEEDIVAFEKAIEDGKSPPNFSDPFEGHSD